MPVSLVCQVRYFNHTHVLL